jgi:hypothetical protein
LHERLQRFAFELSLSARGATPRRGDIDLAGGFIELVDVDRLLERNMITTLDRPQMSLMSEFQRQWLVDFAIALIVGVAPEATITMTVVAPTRIVDDRIEAERVASRE